MFQMNRNLFNQCWPVIARQIQNGAAAAPPADAATPPASRTAVEAGYVLGIAIGYARHGDPAPASGVPLATTPSGWQVEARGKPNWPWTIPTWRPVSGGASRRR